MPVNSPKKVHPDASTQRYLPFSQLRENIVIMKDGSGRMVMKCSTINFLLKNTQEQDAIIVSFQRFLNSINFPIQIMIRSSKLDIDSYLGKLKDKALNQTNSLLQNQTYEYIEYLRKLVEVAQIMKKDFFIVIPYDETGNSSIKDDSLMGPFSSFWKSITGAQDTLTMRSQIRQFQKIKKGLTSRSNTVKVGLENIGIKSEPLSKKELFTFLTDYYNPSLDSFHSVDPESLDITPHA